MRLGIVGKDDKIVGVDQARCGRRYFELKPAQPQRGVQVVLLGTLVLEATEETPVDGVSVMKNPMQGRRSLVFPKVRQPGCRL